MQAGPRLLVVCRLLLPSTVTHLQEAQQEAKWVGNEFGINDIVAAENRKLKRMCQVWAHNCSAGMQLSCVP